MPPVIPNICSNSKVSGEGEKSNPIPLAPTSLSPDASATLADDIPESSSLGQGRDLVDPVSVHSVIVVDPLSVPSHDVIPDDTPVQQVTTTDLEDDGPRAQIDTGAFVSCTDQLHLIHRFKKFSKDYPCPVKMMPASEGSDLFPVGHGFLHVPAPVPSGYLAVRVFYHPRLRTTVIDERDFARAAGHSLNRIKSESISKYHTAGTFTYRATHKLKRNLDVVVHGILRSGKCYTHTLIPCDQPIDSPVASIATSSAYAAATDAAFAKDCELATLMHIYSYQEEEYKSLRDELSQLPMSTHNIPFHEYIQRNTPVAAIKAATERMLWHQRLGHPSDHYLYNAHKHVKGVPHFKHQNKILDLCPTCIRAKQKKESAGPNSTRTATQPYQGLSIDFSFSGVRSDKDRSDDYVGLHGETSWILVSDHFTRCKHGDTRVNKGAPISWLRTFLENHAPTCPDKYVYLDQGGELWGHPEVQQLFKRFGYTVRPTGADSSNQNGPVERGHLVVANAIRSMLLGANLDIKFWPYAFHHWLRIDNSIPSKDQTTAPLTLATGKVDDFSAFRTFGCRVWVRPPGRRSAKLRPNSRKGIFLGFLANTTKNILWYDVETHRVKIAKHARFDEGMNDLPTSDIPPNVVHLQRLQDGQPFEAEADDVTIPPFKFKANPFSHTITKTLKVNCNNQSYGFTVNTDVLNGRAFVQEIKDRSSAAKMYKSRTAAHRAIKLAYFVRINNKLVFSKEDVIAALRECYDRGDKEITFEFAPENYLGAKKIRKALREHDIYDPVSPDDEHVPVLSVDVVRAIAAIRHPGIDFSEDALSYEQYVLAIQTHATPAEQALGAFTRRKLKSLDTWHLWEAGERKQLDRMHALNMYGKPVPPPPGAILLRSHWQYHIKRDGTRRSRNCCDGSPRAAPVLHGIASTYSSCVEQPVQRLFFALAAEMGHCVFGGDATDAFAHSPPPSVPTFVRIDDAYADWYKWRYDVDLDRSHVLPVQHALQGHPESGRLWETHIGEILASPEFGFVPTTHDRCIYTAVVDGVRVLLLRQVDDFALAAPSEDVAKRIYDALGKRLQLPGEDTVPFTYLGLLDDYNGLTVNQYSTCTKLSCELYIDRIMKTHGWDTSSPDSVSLASPLPTDAINSMYAEVGPTEGSPEHTRLVEKHGYAYRTLLGELLYAYITCRPDIGYAAVTLSKFSTCPADIHFALLKKVAKYLRQTRDWGIIFQRKERHPSLPDRPDTPLVHPDDIPAFPDIDPWQLACFVDAAHANDLRNRRSTTGYVFVYGGGAVSYRCKTQSITATSSTEAEFLAAVSAAKQAKYLRAILTDLGFSPPGPTPIYEDNQSAINMVNARIPTERSRHIDIQHFAIQDWKDAGDVVMRFIPGVLNPADDMTKPLGWVLHARHARRLMGHYG